MENKPIIIKGTIYRGCFDIDEIPKGIIVEIKDYDLNDDESDGKDDLGEYKLRQFENTGK